MTMNASHRARAAFLTSVVSLLICVTALPDEPGEKSAQEKSERPAGVGPGRAIPEASKTNGIRLSPQAQELFELRTVSLGEGAVYRVPLESILFIREKKAVYRHRDGWYKLVDVTLVSKTENEAVIQSKALASGDKVVSHGAPLVHLAELNVWVEKEDTD